MLRLVFPQSPMAYWLLLGLETTQGRDQATGRRPAGIACVHTPLGLLHVAALGLLPLTILFSCHPSWHLLLICLLCSPRWHSFAAGTTRPWVNSQTCSLVYVLS